MIDLNFCEEEFDSYFAKWITGIHHEIYFWSHWFKTKGSKWPEGYARRIEKNPGCFLEKYFDSNTPWPPRILDVGSGPISTVGISTYRGNVDLSACDPLALFYRNLFTENEVTPYVIPEFGYAESLLDIYDQASFDFVHMSNALDHSFMPMAAIYSMLSVVKIGGLVVLSSAENEAQQNAYHGLHQWNITEKNGALIFWRENFEINVSSTIQYFCEINVNRIKGEQDTIHAILRRKKEYIPKLTYKQQFDKKILLTLFYLLKEAGNFLPGKL
ncbi:hypothetical protein DSECCO2_646100 [anaerobic digester metagenome]